MITRRSFAKYAAGAIAAVAVVGKSGVATAFPLLPQKKAKVSGLNLSLTQKFELELVRMRSMLPKGMDYFDLGGNLLFPVYGASGGISNESIFYLWKPNIGRSTGIAPFMGVRVLPHLMGGASDQEIAQYARIQLAEAIDDFSKYAKPVAIAGGDLGRDPRPDRRWQINVDGGTLPGAHI